MGYAFHITRAEDWADSESNPISREEWESVANEFAALREDGYIAWRSIGHQKIYAVRHETASFSWREGRIDIEGYFSDAVEAVANNLAAMLGGKVQGDDED